jgi:hypothetical protein
MPRSLLEFKISRLRKSRAAAMSALRTAYHARAVVDEFWLDVMLDRMPHASIGGIFGCQELAEWQRAALGKDATIVSVPHPLPPFENEMPLERAVFGMWGSLMRILPGTVSKEELTAAVMAGEVPALLKAKLDGSKQKTYYMKFFAEGDNFDLIELFEHY